MIEVLIVSSHPVQYAVPLYRRYAADSRVNVTVAFLSLRGAELAVDPDFGVEVRWDVPLLDGYRWVLPESQGRLPRSLRSAVGMWRLIRKKGFDVVLSTGYASAAFWAAIAAAKVSGAALLLMSEQRDFHVRSGWRGKEAIKRVVVPAIYRLADGCCALSSSTAVFFKRIGIQRNRVFLTPYVVDNDYFGRAADEISASEARTRLGVRDGPIALMCGKLVPWKRPWDVLEAAAKVSGLTVLVAGDGPLREQLRRHAMVLGISDRVRWLGFVNQSELPTVYAAADFLVLPSASEGFGLVVNEIFNFSKPVIATRVTGAVGDLVIDGETGYVVDVGDVDAIAEGMRVLAEDDDVRQRMGSRAKERIESWGPDQHVEAFVEACQTVARRKRERA